MGQEPGTAEEIAEFCSTTYGVTFPLLAKTDVNGADRHPLYAELTKAADADGEAGDIQWNFEKFLLAPGGEVVNRFRPRTEPDAPEVIGAIEAVLPRSCADTGWSTAAHVSETVGTPDVAILRAWLEQLIVSISGIRDRTLADVDGVPRRTRRPRTCPPRCWWRRG